MLKAIRKALVACLAFLVIIVLAGCTGDTGPAGPAGTVECMSCHGDDSPLPAISGQYAASTHATGGNFERNGSSCAFCHTNEGFIEYAATGDMISPENPSAVGCFTCHMPHTSGDFSLRKDDAVDLTVGETFDMGAGNLCANCHQTRPQSPAISPAGVEVESERWGPHHGGQANVLAGTGGYELDGYFYSNSPHTNGIDDGCVTCHMQAPYGAVAGGHTMAFTYEYHGHDEPLLNSCNTADCHDGGVEDLDYDDVQTEVAAALEALGAELLAQELIDEDHLVDLHGGDSVMLTEVEAAAIWNYLLILEDRSLGIHNSNYSLDLLESSLDALTR